MSTARNIGALPLDAFTDLAYMPLALARNGELSDAGFTEAEDCIGRAVAAHNELREQFEAALVPELQWQCLDERALALVFGLRWCAGRVEPEALARRWVSLDPYSTAETAHIELERLHDWMGAAVACIKRGT